MRLAFNFYRDRSEVDFANGHATGYSVPALFTGFNYTKSCRVERSKDAKDACTRTSTLNNLLATWE